MSSYLPPQPYIAPWQTEFNRYSTQAISNPTIVGTAGTFTIPTLRWWRLVSLQTVYQFSGTVADRLIRLYVFRYDSALLYASVQPGASAASFITTATWLPGVAAYSVTDLATHAFTLAPLPDVLWGPGTQFAIDLLNKQSGDAYLDTPTLLAEVYTEDYNDNGEPVLVPTPLIS